uniref:Large ribosomal subunit protein uL22c n=1 Tax=Cyanidium caldarium TaxID=2771 RepID=RK22_CYACA|nr:ribosomal protein L22 [Cyanidium caldarium]Q9TLT7.1 RecName: Full=Large ribosomal subunit protein uL22c; AltName: Full=50S ribosomal protein L22, chloroplastic [Cyanidium caldarium]AAF12912.1 unknown [Cyanidium caldarium]WDB00307.1 ribosomal protein L22 [Cyanidium caldarium]
MKATIRFIKISPTKVRRITNQIKGLKYADACILLKFMKGRIAKTILKLVNSAFSNSRYSTFADLRIQTVLVEKGPIFNRFQPRAKGRAYPIKKYTSHIKVVLS